MDTTIEEVYEYVSKDITLLEQVPDEILEIILNKLIENKICTNEEVLDILMNRTNLI